MDRIADWFRSNGQIIKRQELELRSIRRGIERSIYTLDSERKDKQRELYDLIKTGDRSECRRLAREIIHMDGQIQQQRKYHDDLRNQMFTFSTSQRQQRVTEALMKSANALSVLNKHTDVTKVEAAADKYEEATSELAETSELISAAIDSGMGKYEDETFEERVDTMLSQVADAMTMELPSAPIGVRMQEADTSNIIKEPIIARKP